MELRGRKISYAAIAELLQQHVVKTSRARVAEYGRIILNDGKSRKRRKQLKITPTAKTPATPQSMSIALKQVAPTNDVPLPLENPYVTRGPRIAKVEL